jgi:hypothetical protein
VFLDFITDFFGHVIWCSTYKFGHPSYIVYSLKGDHYDRECPEKENPTLPQISASAPLKMGKVSIVPSAIYRGCSHEKYEKVLHKQTTLKVETNKICKAKG